MNEKFSRRRLPQVLIGQLPIERNPGQKAQGFFGIMSAATGFSGVITAGAYHAVSKEKSTADTLSDQKGAIKLGTIISLGCSVNSYSYDRFRNISRRDAIKRAFITAATFPLGIGLTDVFVRGNNDLKQLGKDISSINKIA